MARKKAVTQASTETLESRVYELGFLLSPAVREEDLDARTNEIKDLITNASGTIIAEGRPEFIDLAYEMSKVIDNKGVRFNQGYFGWIKFNLFPNQVKELQALIEKNLLVIRYILVSTVAENTVVSKKPISKILKSTARLDISESDIAEDIEIEDEVDPGIAAAELQTPVNEPEEVVESVTEPTEAE
jgi:ribosomal protein S6